MRLEGQAKSEFEKWYFIYAVSIECLLSVDEFYDLPSSMKFGVFTDWFRTVLVHFDFVEIFTKGFHNDIVDCQRTVGEARTEAINKAMTNFNNRK